MDDELKLKRARKVTDNGTGPFAVPLAQLTESIITNDKLDALLEKDFPEEIEITLEGVESLKGEKGDPSEYPQEISVSNLPEVQKVEVVNSGLEFANMLFRSLKGEKGDSYVLTEKDKKEIAAKVKVPVVEKIVETVTVKEPVITNEVKEVAVYEEAEQIADKLNAFKGILNMDVVRGLKDAIEELVNKRMEGRGNATYGRMMNKYARKTTLLVDAATIAVDCTTTDLGLLNTLSQSSTFANPGGTALYDGQTLEFRITSASSQSLTWGSLYRGSGNVPLPSSTTGSNKSDYIGFKWNQFAGYWDCAATSPGF